MERTYAKNVKPGKISVAGWVEETRKLGGLVFLKLRDMTGYIQITLPKKKVSENVFKIASSLTKESVVSVDGEAVANKEAPGGIEIIPSAIKVISTAKPLPIEFLGKVDTTFDKLLDYRSLSLRTRKNQAIFKIQSTIIHGFIEYLDKKGFLQIFTPCILGAASEGGAEVFSVDYYKKRAFLRQDPQLHRQLAIAAGLEKIYEVGASWRAEMSHTTRHLSEHRVLAAEMAFIKDEYDVIKIEEEMVLHCLKKIKNECADELEIFDTKIEIPDKIPVLKFPEVYDILEGMGKIVKRGEEYDTEAEELLWKWVKEKYKTDLFFVNRFPSAAKPFYVMKYDEEPEWARSVDLLYRGVELSSGGQREHRYDKIIEQAKEKRIPLESIKWFAEFFQYGVPPHGGFAIGIERMTKQLLGLANIREATLFPRDTERLLP